MAEIVTLKNGHPLIGTWHDAAEEGGSSVQFTIRPAGATFQVTAVDTCDGEQLAVSNVRWNGRVLSFDSLVPSNGHRLEYTFELISPSEVLVRYTAAERWSRSEPTA
jgi:hypothetical protein